MMFARAGVHRRLGRGLGEAWERLGRGLGGLGCCCDFPTRANIIIRKYHLMMLSYYYVRSRGSSQEAWERLGRPGLLL